MTPQLFTQPLPYQVTGIEKLAPLKVGGLFMPMGTGKTLTAMALVLRRWRKIDKVVVFCPVNVKLTWRAQLQRHLDSPAVYLFDDRTQEGQIPKVQWYVVGIESVGQSDRVTLAANSLITDRTFVILDESDTCKNHAARRTQRITGMSSRARYRLALTGTPVGEGVADLFAQMYFLSPDILGYRSFYSFAANHLVYSEKYPGLVERTLNVDRIARCIDPFVYQVAKDECLTLPRKLHTTRYCCLSDEQMGLYQQAKDEILLSVPDDEITSYTIFRLFSALREIVSGFWVRYAPEDYASWGRWRYASQGEMITCNHDRIDTLMAAIAEISADKKVIIWSNYRYSTEQITAALASAFGRDSYGEFHGGAADRDADLERWWREARFLVASPRCGGRGIDMTCAAHQIFYNNDFPYRLREQAEDRSHRLGITERPTYIDIVATAYWHTIDERIAEALARKENLAKSFKRELDKLKPAERRSRLAAL